MSDLIRSGRLVQNTWSDAAREAALEARRANSMHFMSGGKRFQDMNATSRGTGAYADPTGHNPLEASRMARDGSQVSIFGNPKYAREATDASKQALAAAKAGDHKAAAAAHERAATAHMAIADKREEKGIYGAGHRTAALIHSIAADIHRNAKED